MKSRSDTSCRLHSAVTVSSTTVLPVKKEVFGQPLGSNDLEDDLVGLQGFPVHPTGQGGVEALGQPLAYRQLLWNHLVFCIVLQNLGCKVHTTVGEGRQVLVCLFFFTYIQPSCMSFCLLNNLQTTAVYFMPGSVCDHYLVEFAQC